MYGCTEEAYLKVPNLVFNIGGIDYPLPRSEWLPRRENTCIVQLMNSRHPMTILGINWLQTYYTAFDMENKRIGFAESIYSKLDHEDS